MSDNIIIAGVGTTPFVKPGSSGTYKKMTAEAVGSALADAGLEYSDIQQAFVGFVYADTTSGQAALYEVGKTGIPITNVNNACSSGSTALFQARQAILSGEVDCVLGVGFEQMVPGSIDLAYLDRPSPLQNFIDTAESCHPGSSEVPFALQLFGAARHEYIEKYGISEELLAMVRVKAADNALRNEKALFRKAVSVEDVLASPSMFLGLRRLECSPPACGAGAVILCSEKFAKKHGVKSDVAMLGQVMVTDKPSTFESKSMTSLVGTDVTKEAAQKLYAKTSRGPEDIQVVELHDCFVINEILSYEGLGLCEEGQAGKFIADKDNTYGGRFVTNPSGGLLAKGHPLGATGLAQCAELVWQLRGQAGERQVDDVQTALQHNFGLGGACIVSMYGRV